MSLGWGRAGGASEETRWSAFRDAVLDGRFSKDTLFQFCYLMVDTSLRLNLEVPVVEPLQTGDVTLTRSFNLSGPQCAHLQSGDSDPCLTVSNHDVIEGL